MDIAKKTGYACLSNGKVTYDNWQLYPTKSKFNEKEIHDMIKKIKIKGKIKQVVYEKQGGNLNAHNNGYLKGALLQHLSKNFADDVEIIGINPKKWQKWVSLKLGYSKIPTDTKKMSVKYANEKYNIELNDKEHDIADALCLLSFYKEGEWQNTNSY